MIFRLQFHTGAVQSFGLVFGKEDLDNASQGGATADGGAGGGGRGSLVISVLVQPHAPDGEPACCAVPVFRNAEPWSTEHSGKAVELRHHGDMGAIRVGLEAQRCPCFLATASLSSLTCDFFFSDDRFPDNGKIELLFSATPEKLKGRRRAECRGAVLTRWGGGSCGVSVQSPAFVRVGKLP